MRNIHTLQKLLKVSRPISWVNTAYPFAAAYCISGAEITLFFWLGTLFFLIPYNLLMYGINDIFDYESDIKNPRKGGIEGAMEQKELHPAILIASVASSLPFVVYLLLQGPLIASSTLIITLFFVVAYSVKGLRFKEIPFLDSITSSLHFTGPMLYAFAVTRFEPAYIPFVLAFFLWGVASHAFGAVQDIVPDRQANIASIATILGARKTVVIVVGLYVTAMVVVAFQGLAGIVVSLIGLLYVLNCVSYLTITDDTSWKTNAAWRRFIWLNFIAGFAITMLLIINLV